MQSTFDDFCYCFLPVLGVHPISQPEVSNLDVSWTVLFHLSFLEAFTRDLAESVPNMAEFS